jgi:ABC-2 type transport system ATP-binding protein
VIEFVEVTKRYGDFPALDGASLDIAEGSITGLIGPNGAGKTTSMEIVASLLTRDAGRVRIGGYDPEDNAAAVRAIVGYMPDFFGVYEGLTSIEYLEFFAAAGGVSSRARPGLISDLLALVDLENKADADVNGLSRGMKQRLSLARALVHDPELLILDEPASGLDPRARVQLRELIGELSRMNKTVLISSHILAELEGICSHLAVVDDGKVVVQGEVGEIRNSLQAATAVLVRVPFDQIESAESVLRDQTAASNLVVERDHLTITLPNEPADVAAALATLVEAGIAVWEWRIQSAGLEELFLKLTRDGEERGG